MISPVFENTILWFNIWNCSSTRWRSRDGQARSSIMKYEHEGDVGTIKIDSRLYFAGKKQFAVNYAISHPSFNSHRFKVIFKMEALDLPHMSLSDPRDYYNFSEPPEMTAEEVSAFEHFMTMLVMWREGLA